MFLDRQSLRSNQELRADVLIIGSGPAGLALFLQLDRAGVDVLLLESGGLRPDKAAQELNDGESSPEPYPFAETRVRAFGGASHLWTGICVPPDRSEFDGVEGAPSPWPIPYDELAPYLDAAMGFFGLPPLHAAAAAVAPPAVGDPRLEAKPLYFPAELRLSRAYREPVGSARFGRALLNASAVELTASAGGKLVDRVQVRTADGKPLTVRPRRVVLAAGGVESPRLLLNSPGLSVASPLVGRFFTERPHILVGEFNTAPDPEVLRAAGPLLADAAIPGGCVRWAVALRPELRAREGVAGCWLRLYGLLPSEAAESVAAHQRLWAAVRTDERPAAFGALLKTMASDPFALARYYAARAGGRFSALSDRRLVAAVTVEMEQQPENRVALASRTDRFSRPLPHLHWSWSDNDRRTLERSVALFSETLEPLVGTPLKRFDGEPWPRSIRNKVGAHHMGAARMADSADRGVVDRDCRVHGVENLWIASSAVFPAAGAANPTLAIVALALRLADRLAASRSSPGAQP